MALTRDFIEAEGNFGYHTHTIAVDVLTRRERAEQGRINVMKDCGWKTREELTE